MPVSCNTGSSMPRPKKSLSSEKHNTRQVTESWRVLCFWVDFPEIFTPAPLPSVRGCDASLRFPDYSVV